MLIKKKIKVSLILILVLLLSMGSYSAIVSDDDGSTFITKAEFDALKINFQTQLTNYNNSISGKIDGAISSYLSGIKVSTNYILDSLVNKCNVASAYGRDVKFIKALTDKTVSYPNGSWTGINFIRYQGRQNRGSIFLTAGNDGSNYEGSLVYMPRISANNTNWNAYSHFVGVELKSYVKNGITYWCVDEKNNLFDVVYLIMMQSFQYAWNYAFLNASGTTELPSLGTTWTVPSVDDTKFTLDSNGYVDWENMQKNFSLSLPTNNMYDWLGSLGAKADIYFNIDYRQKYQVRSRPDWKDLGYLSDTFNKNIYYVDKTKWDKGVYINGTTATDNCSARYQQFKDNGSDYKFTDAGAFTIETAVYWHDIKSINVDHLINETATGVVPNETNPVLLYEGLPLFTSGNDGTVKFTLRGTASTYNGSAVPSTWTGKLYISDSKFGKSTTQSSCTKKGDSSKYTGYWTISNTTPTATIELQVKKGETYWLKYNVDTTTTGLCVGFETVGDVVLTVDN